ncbi:Protein of unknown function (DUF2818) [Gulbenkiania indica]|uniref:DUF2818 family protein n=1 Tax=Gulbenkiania indica TaxID=375574 RepID=A0A0K6H8D5_9NEIS|nr:DUF2818 family protein [Gulbenkiania indica]CUA87023.1 Protein of unknown function (DUF2818) [Gulbenkiania indica]
MNNSVALLLVVAFIAANLPFLTTRVAGMFDRGAKHFGWHLLELVVLFGLVGLLARFLEGRHTPVHPQNWQFYVTTFSLFLVFAFPGFVGRYFWKRR